jgi:predicted Zn-dependent peptidase
MMQTYFAGHPLGHDVLGTKDSIGNLQVEQMRDYHARRYSANNLVFAIAGNFDWQKTLDLVQRACGDWTSGEEGRQAEPFIPKAGREIISKDKLKQQIMLLAWPTVSVEDDDIYPMELASMVLGDGSGSRMFWNIFQKGLAETAAASLSPLDRTGLMLAYLSTTPDEASAVLELTLAELKSLQQDGVHEDELRRAKDKLVSRTVLAHAGSRLYLGGEGRVALAGGRGRAHRGGDTGGCAPCARPLPRHGGACLHGVRSAGGDGVRRAEELAEDLELCDRSNGGLNWRLL